MQCHNFTAVTQKYPERSCNMKATVAQIILFLSERGPGWHSEVNLKGLGT